MYLYTKNKKREKESIYEPASGLNSVNKIFWHWIKIGRQKVRQVIIYLKMPKEKVSVWPRRIGVVGKTMVLG